MANAYVVISDSPHRRWAAHTWLRAPYTILAELLGDPGNGHRDAGNLRTAWLLESAASSAETFFVHDLRDDGPLSEVRSGSPYDWHVHGPDRDALARFCRWLSDQVIERVRARPAARRLTASSREKINALVASGTPPGDAMKRAAEWEPALDAASFAWPIAGRADGPC